MMNKKGQREIAIGKLLGLILIALVIVLVLFFIFRVDLQRHMQFIPDFTPAEPEEIITDEEIEAIEAARRDALENCLGNEVGFFGEPERIRWYSRLRQFIYVDGNNTFLYIRGNEILHYPTNRLAANVTSSLVNAGYPTLELSHEFRQLIWLDQIDLDLEVYESLNNAFIEGRRVCPHFSVRGYFD